MTGIHVAGMAMRKRYLLAIYLMASSLVTAILGLYPGLDVNAVARTAAMIEGTANKPYVCRALLPLIVRGVSELTPEIIRRAIDSASDNSLTAQRFIDAFLWDREYIYQYLILHVLFILCFIGFAYSLRRLITVFYDFPRFVSDLAPVGALIALPLYFRYCSYLYDPAVIFLFTLGIEFIVTGNRALYYLVFILSSLNKETSILLIALFILHEWSTIGKSRLAIHALSQALIWILIKAGLAIAYINNPGTLIRFHLLDHNLVLYRYPTTLIYFVAILLVHMRLIVLDWRKKPIFLRRGLLLTLIPLMVLAFVSGFVDELRDYYEAFPFIVLLALPTVVRMFGLTRDSYGVHTTDRTKLSDTNA